MIGKDGMKGEDAPDIMRTGIMLFGIMPGDGCGPSRSASRWGLHGVHGAGDSLLMGEGGGDLGKYLNAPGPLIVPVMKVLWICGLPNDVRLNACDRVLSPTSTAAWSWILGHLPPPEGVELHIICPVGGLYAPRVDFEYKGAHWHCFRRHRFELPLLWIRFYLQIKGFVQKLNPDVVHGWGGETGCGRVATLLSKRAVVSVQGLLLLYWQLLKCSNGIKADVSAKTRLAWFVEKLTYRKAGKLLVESMASMRGLEEYYGMDGEFVPHPLRDAFLRFDLSKRKALVERSPKFVFVGSLIDRKGAVDAVQAFIKANIDSSHFVMIGDGGERSKLSAVARKAGFEDRIKILSALSPEEIASEFSDAQFFLLPSYGDTGPTALKEALSCGLYPICYDNSGPKDLICRYRCGKLVKTADVEGLVDIMKKCCCEVENCVRIGERAATSVRAELSRENVWRILVQAYKTK